MVCWLLCLGGAFDGLQGLDFILFGLLALGGFFLFRKMRRKSANVAGATSSDHQPQASTDHLMGRQPAFEGGQQDSPTPGSAAVTPVAPSPELPAGGSGIVAGDDVPENLPGGFDQDAFLEGAREHYTTLQKAWNENNLSLIKEYMSPELLEQLKEERNKIKGKQSTEVLFVDAHIARADYTARVAQISIRYSGRCKDSVTNVEEEINDIWHLERDITNADAPWLIVGME